MGPIWRSVVYHAHKGKSPRLDHFPEKKACEWLL